MHVSYAELIRIAPEALRMLGIPFGHADDAVEGLVWTECVLGAGYAALKAARDRREACGWAKPRLSHAASAFEFAGTPFLLYAARLADLVRISVPEGLSKFEIHDASGKLVLPYVAHRLAAADLSVVLFWRGGA